MTNTEFSDKFTILLDSYGAPVQFGDTKPVGRIVLNEYEKSVFLTMAQKELSIALYSGRNFMGESFEETEETRRYLDCLVRTSLCDEDQHSHIHISENSEFYVLPQDVAFIIHEQADVSVSCGGVETLKTVDVVPVMHDEYNRIKRNPFRNASEKRVLRIDSGNNVVELVSKYPISSYSIRYLANPEPIILEDLSGTGVSIDGIQSETECSLNPMLHDIILRRAVQIAVSSKGNN